MSLTMNQGGWTGKVLRVDLTNRTATALDTAANFGQYWGGTGIGYKAIYDAIQARLSGTSLVGTTRPSGFADNATWARNIAWYDPDAPVTWGYGPLTGTGALCGGRTAITAMSAAHVYPVPNTGHHGGHFSAQAKYAGWDSIIVVGQASGPVYIAIKDDDVQIVDAPQLWHCGIFKVTEEITAAMGKGTQVSCIGQAGQNLVPMSTCMNAVSHSAGGIGANIGVKNLLGVGVLGTGTVKIAASSAKWKTLIDYALSIVGSNNQASVPNTLQSWAEYSPASSSTRWWAYDGMYWGAADPPVNTGNCDPHDRQTIGYRCFKADQGYSPNFTVRMDGCHACPVRCHQAISVPSAVKWGPKTTAMNTCIGWWLSTLIPATNNAPTGAASLAMAGSQVATQASGAVIGAATVGGLSPTEKSLRTLETYVVGHSIQDDYGITSYYGTVNGGWGIILNGNDMTGTARDLVGANNTVGTLGSHYIKPCVPAAEWTSLTSSTGLLGLIAMGDLTATKEFGRLMAFKIGNLGTFVGGRCDEQWALWSAKLTPLGDAAGQSFAAHTNALTNASWRSDTDLGAATNVTGGTGPGTYTWGQMCRDASGPLYFNWGYPKHHSWEDGAQIGGMNNIGYNRDPQNHTVVNMKTTGLPMALQKKIVGDQFAKYYTVDFPIPAGSGLTMGGALTGMDKAFDDGMGGTANSKYTQANVPTATPVNWQKARATRFMWARKELQDSLSVCGWMYPWFACCLKERGYQGDASLEVQYFNAVTGNNLTTLQLDQEGERFHILHKVLTAYLWGNQTTGFGSSSFIIPGAWANKSFVAEGALGVAAPSSPSAPGVGTTFGVAAFSPYSTANNTAGSASLAPVSFTARPMNTPNLSYRVQHDNPCPAWGIASAPFTVGGGYYSSYADWNTGMEMVYSMLYMDYLDGTHTTDSGLPTSACYAKYGMDASGSANVQALMTSAGLLPW